MIAKTILTTFAFCLLAACAHEEQALAVDPAPKTISIDGFSLYERAQVLRAVNEWNSRGANLSIVEGNGAQMSIVANRTPYEAKANLCGMALGKQIAAVYMNSGCDLCATARHEIGHLLGLGHTHGGWMHPSVGNRRCGEG